MNMNETHMEHYIAIDNVCAWPNLTRMPDGTIIATIFNQPCHGLWEGDVECWASQDGGRLWTLRGTPAPHEPGTNRMNVAAGLAADGALVVIASGWTHRPRQGEGTAGHGGDARPLLPWVCRSTDGGRTWMHAETLTPPENKSARIIPFGDVVRLQDDTLGVCIYSWQPPYEHNCTFYSSDDDGRTWSSRGVIRESNINETTPLVLANGDLLACARTLDDQHLDLFRSTDHGRTWTGEVALTGAMQHPAHLLALADGRILLTYGRRGEPFFQGIGYRLSDDDGRTWSEPATLQESNHRKDMQWPHSDGGYPASVQLDDSRIVTAWYSSAVPGVHERYHMGAAVWTLPVK
jgi:Neuraminidase (sialidase)